MPQRVLRTSDPRERIRLLATFVRDLHERLSDLLTGLFLGGGR
jgi:hypothetical protein